MSQGARGEVISSPCTKGKQGKILRQQQKSKKSLVNIVIIEKNPCVVCMERNEWEGGKLWE